MTILDVRVGPPSPSPMCRQVRPASVDLYTPVPTETFERMCGSPVPAQTIDGSEGATARAPIEWSI